MTQIEIFNLLRKLWINGQVRNRLDLEVLSELLTEGFIKRYPGQFKLGSKSRRSRAQKELFADLQKIYRKLSYGKNLGLPTKPKQSEISEDSAA